MRVCWCTLLNASELPEVTEFVEGRFLHVNNSELISLSRDVKMPLYYTPVARSAELAHSAGILNHGFTAGTEKRAHFPPRMQQCADK